VIPQKKRCIPSADSMEVEPIKKLIMAGMECVQNQGLKGKVGCENGADKNGKGGNASPGHDPARCGDRWNNSQKFASAARSKKGKNCVFGWGGGSLIIKARSLTTKRKKRGGRSLINEGTKGARCSEEGALGNGA